MTMSPQRNPFWFWPVVIILVVLFLLTKYASPSWVESLAADKNYSFLNAITRSQGEQSLAVYSGMAEEKLFGPLSVVFSGAAFLLLAYRYLITANAFTFSVAVFFYLLITKSEVLFFPPYGDTASGPLMEAIWLCKNNFDFVGLYHQEAYIGGGPKVYLFSIYPSYIAALMKLIHNPQVFIVINHFFVFIYGAIIIAVYRNLLLKIFDEKISLLLSIFLLALPLFQSQVEAINMEIPNVLFSILSIYYLAEKRVGVASLMAVLAILVKGVAILIGAVVFAASVFLFFFDQKCRGKRSVLIWGVLILTFVGVMTYLNFFVLYGQNKVLSVGALSGWRELKKLPVTYLSLASLLVFSIDFFRRRFPDKKISLIRYFQEHYIAFIIFTCVLAWYGLYLQSQGAQYRYRLLLSPFSTFIIFYAWNLIWSNKMVQKILLIFAIIFSFWCSYGWLYPPHELSAHAALERSLEYRNDLKVHIKLAKEIEERFSKMTIAAPLTIAHILAFPELGFVKKKLDVMIYDFPSTYENLRMFQGLDPAKLYTTLWVGFKTHVPESLKFLGDNYPVSPQDKIIDEIIVGNRKATLFLGGFAVEQQRLIRLEMIKQFYKSGILKSVASH